MHSRPQVSAVLAVVTVAATMVIGVSSHPTPAGATHCDRAKPDPDIARAWPAPFTAIAPSPCSNGYRILLADGGLFAFGAATYAGSVPELRQSGAVIGPSPTVDLAATPSGAGYWMIDATGGVFAFGDAGYRGSLPHLRALGALRADVTAVRIVPTHSGRGYFILDRSGGVFAFGDARYRGSLPWLRATGRLPGAVPAVDMALTPSGRGYWITDAGGGVYAFGDARYLGSLPALRAAGRLSGNTPAVAMGSLRRGRGYVILDRSGGVHAFGDARFLGSAAGRESGLPATDIAMAPSGSGYWVLFSSGGVHAFGDARDFGSAGGSVAADLFRRLNGERAARGLPGLRWDAAAAAAAERWSPHMAATGYRHGASGSLGSAYAATGENLFALPAGMATSGHAHRGWMGSGGHRANIVEPGFDAVGIGAHCSSDGTLWVTQVFVRDHGSSRPPLSSGVPPATPLAHSDTGGVGC